MATKQSDKKLFILGIVILLSFLLLAPYFGVSFLPNSTEEETKSPGDLRAGDNDGETTVRHRRPAPSRDVPTAAENNVPTGSRDSRSKGLSEIEDLLGQNGN